MGDDALKMALNEAMTGRFLHQLPSPPKKTLWATGSLSMCAAIWPASRTCDGILYHQRPRKGTKHVALFLQQVATQRSSKYLHLFDVSRIMAEYPSASECQLEMCVNFRTEEPAIWPVGYMVGSSLCFMSRFTRHSVESSLWSITTDDCG